MKTRAMHCRATTRQSLSSLLNLAFEVRYERQKLKRLDAQALQDIGLTSAEALAESRRGFFDLPANRTGSTGISELLCLLPLPLAIQLKPLHIIKWKS